MNSGWLPILVGVLYLVIHIASIIAKEASKRKERERKMEQAERRRMAEARLEIPPPGATPGTAPAQMQPSQWQRPASAAGAASPPARSAGHVDDLMLRRKQQLEQLRARQGGAAPPQMRTTQIPGRVASPPTQAQPARRIDADADRQRRDRAQAELQVRTDRQHAAVARAQKLQQVQRQAQQQRKQELDQLATAIEPPRQHAIAISSSKPSSAITSRLHDRTALREVFILKELIDRPIALRGQQI